MKITAFVSTLALGLFVAGSAFALDAAAPDAPAKPTTATTSKPTMKVDAPKADAAAKGAKSVECSKEADAKGLHGKERKKFREKCKKGESA